LKTGMRHSDYIKVLLDKRKDEIRQIDPIHEVGDRITSPPGATPLEESRFISEYMEQKNLHTVVNAKPEMKKSLLLKKFFKMRRNQEVIIYLLSKGDTSEITGKVSAIGRDFVMLTSLKDRIWIPYNAIQSANILAGVPTYEGAHQNFIYDNDLKRKLTTSFGETVAKRDVLIQQFFEETLMTSLDRWQGIWVNVITLENTYWGKIISASDKSVMIKHLKDQIEIELNQITHIYSMRLLMRLYMVGKKMLKNLAKRDS
jgi:ribosome maturation factor RimP